MNPNVIIYTNGKIIQYKEGDKSLERDKITHIPKETDQYHIIKEEDTLDFIAGYYYGDDKLWYIIADVNNIINPFNLTMGQTIIIPDLSTALSLL